MHACYATLRTTYILWPPCIYTMKYWIPWGLDSLREIDTHKKNFQFDILKWRHWLRWPQMHDARLLHIICIIKIDTNSLWYLHNFLHQALPCPCVAVLKDSTTFKMHSYAVFYYAHPYTLHFNRAVCTILSHILLCRHARTLYIFLLLANINNVWKCVKKYARAACIGWCQPLPLSFSCIVRKRCCKPHCYTNLFSVFFFFFLLLTRWHFELRWKVVWPESKERLCIYTNSLCVARCPAS